MEFDFEPVCDQVRAGSSYLGNSHTYVIDVHVHIFYNCGCLNKYKP